MASADAGGAAAFAFDLPSLRSVPHLLVATYLVLVSGACGLRGVRSVLHGLATFRCLDEDPHFYHLRYLLVTVVKRVFC